MYNTKTMNNNINLVLSYIWTGGNGELRTKTKVKKISNGDKTDLFTYRKNIEELLKLKLVDEWNYDGSSTGQAPGGDSEVILKPMSVFIDPFQDNKPNMVNLLVLCETYLPNGDPHKTNTRSIANKIFEEGKWEDKQPMFGIELEFFVNDIETGYPLGFDKNGKPLSGEQGPYYCSIGAGKCYGRDFIDECLNKTLEAELNVTGSNMEVCCGQMEIQICSTGIKAADECLILKYILERVGEKYGYIINYSAKPLKGDWNGSGCHINYSTKDMREEGGITIIMDAINKLKEKHDEHIKVYGDDNSERLTGLHETSPITEFTFGVANRGASIRIPRITEANGCGYFEDRRPAASCDLYLATSKIFETCG